MHLRELTLFFVLILGTLDPALPLDVQLNEQPLRSWNDDELLELAYAVPAGTGFVPGIALDEILPLLGDAFRLTAAGEWGSRTWEGGGLAERFPRWYLAALPTGGWELLVEGERAGPIRKLEVYGEPLAEKRLEVWVSWEGVPRLKEEIGRFAALHGAQIKVVEVPKTESKLISVLRAGGQLPDLVMVQSDYLPSLVSARAIQSLDYLSFESVVPQGREAFTLEGRSWAVPFYFDCQLVFYNPGLLPRRPSPDWTLADLEGLAGAVLRTSRQAGREVAPISWNAYSAYWLAAFQLGFGKERLVDADGSIRIDDEPTGKALAYLLELQERDLLQVMEREAMVSLFASGRVAMILSGSYSIPIFESLELDFDVAPYPHNSETGRPLSPFLDFKGWAISRRTYSPILARRLIQYLDGIGVQQRFPAALSKLPVHRQSWQLMQETNRYYPVLARSAEIGTPVPPERSYGVYKNTMWKLLRFVFSAQMGIGEALEQGQRVIDAQLGANR